MKPRKLTHLFTVYLRLNGIKLRDYSPEVIKENHDILLEYMNTIDYAQFELYVTWRNLIRDIKKEWRRKCTP